MKLLVLLALIAQPASAASLENTFQAYVKVRRVEEGLALRSDPHEEKQKLAAELAQTQTEFTQTLHAEEAAATPWEKAVLNRIEKRKAFTGGSPGDDQTMTFLHHAFPHPRELSPLEWQAIGEWFGSTTQEKFLRRSFGLTELPTGKGEALPLVWVRDPFRKLLPKTDGPEKSDLEKISSELTVLDITAFPKLEDQAEELRHSLLSLGDRPFVIVSEGNASAVVFKLLDLYPGLRDRENIRGWVNVNGRLYGCAVKGCTAKKSRAPASLADQFSEEALRDLENLRQESFVRSAPLGRGFPIVNLISLEKSRRPSANLREALVAEGTSWTVSRGSAGEKIGSTLPMLLMPAR